MDYYEEMRHNERVKRWGWLYTLGFSLAWMAIVAVTLFLIAGVPKAKAQGMAAAVTEQTLQPADIYSIERLTNVGITALRGDNFAKAYALLHTSAKAVTFPTLKSYEAFMFAKFSPLLYCSEYRFGAAKMAQRGDARQAFQEVHLSDRRGVPWVAFFGYKKDGDFWRLTSMVLQKSDSTGV